MIYIVGIGPGHPDYILPRAVKVLEQCDIIIGFKRAIDSLNFIKAKKIYMKKLSDIDMYICDDKIYGEYQNHREIESSIENIAVVASGDPTFYGITNYVKVKSKKNFQVIPGISSFQYLTAKVSLPWNNAYLGSLHGRKDEFITQVNEHDVSIWLTDKDNNPNVLCKILCEGKIECSVVIGENLSYDDEVINVGKPFEFVDKNISDLNIFIVHKK